MSTTATVAETLVAMLREQKNVEAIDHLYAESIHTEEADSSRTRSGKNVVYAAMKSFDESHIWHYTHIEGPLVSGENFALRLRFEATNQESNQSFAVDEIGVYTVRDGKIIREQFFYNL